MKNLKNGHWLLILCMTFFAALITAGCHSDSSSREKHKILDSANGLASYYGHYFDGKETASGKIFDSDDLVAAHPSYPLHTIVDVTNLENDKSVKVTVIDRGPAKKYQNEGVIIDLSKGAAQQLGMVEDGRVKVKVAVTKWGDDKRE